MIPEKSAISAAGVEPIKAGLQRSMDVRIPSIVLPEVTNMQWIVMDRTSGNWQRWKNCNGLADLGQ